MPENQKAFKLIAVKNREYDRLGELGRTPDSFNDVISRLLDAYEKNRTTTTNVALTEAAITN